MAVRLLRALDDYVLNLPEDGEIREPEQMRTPFQVVRPNAVLPTTASTLMRRMKNYGKRGVKRQPGSEASSSTQRNPAVIRLPSESSSSFSLMKLEGEEETDLAGGRKGGGEGGGQRRVGRMPDKLFFRRQFPKATGLLERSQSVPTNLHFSDGQSPLWVKYHYQQLCYSSPSLLGEKPSGFLSSFTKTVAVLEEGGGGGGGVETAMCVLHTLLDMVRNEWRVGKEEVKVRERGVLAVCRVLDQYSSYTEVVVQGYRVMRGIVCVSADLTTPTIVNAAITVLDSMTQHCHCEQVQLNGCRTLTELCKAGMYIILGISSY